MARVRNCWTHSKKATLIWAISAIIFLCVFQMALRNSSDNYHSTSSGHGTDTPTTNAEKRLRLYDKMERDLDEHGAVFLKHGETSQSLSLSDIFTLKDGSVTPILKAAIPPVRANVLYMSTEHSVPISEVVRGIFLPYFEKVSWFQNSTLYHFSMFHASHHIAPVPATEQEIEAEANAVKTVVDALCPIKIVLDRVVLTSTGVLLGCWQYDDAILHTSFARLLGHPNTSPEEVDKTSELQFFHKLVARLNNELRGFQATVSELWYVEEFDMLALALNGRTKIRKFQLGCSKT
ncbi:uncharacterized protein LOC132283507 isoform X5 [Cornus florida]|uniref:uncharacterized protein LOC132283507 isoform X5 n=1 Tax=Cornus florida TaxID=4283 RepID=UPI00289CF345|nr:uncharacterized protein LOC132283507 isoform X5 [Cornus florida]